MNTIISKLQELQKFKQYIQEIEEKNSPITISGLSDVGKIQFAYSTKQSLNRPICIVTYNEIEARKIVKDLSYFTNEFEEVLYFPKREIASYDYIAESKDLPYERIEVLNKIQKKKAKIVVTTVEALMQKMITKSSLYKNCLEFKVGKRYSLEEVKQNLILLGYERNDLIEGKGQFSVRGDIIDVALTETKGVRVELWGDEVDSIRNFSISSQRSNEMLDRIEIMPAHEFILENELKNVVSKIQNNNEYIDKLKAKGDYRNKIEEIINKDIELIESGDYISKIDKYFNRFYDKTETFLDYLENDFVILFDELSKIKQRSDNILIENKNLIKALIEKEKYVPESILNIEQIDYVSEDKQVVYLEKQDLGAKTISNTKYNFNYRDVKYYKSEIEILIGDLIKALNDKKEIVVLAGNKEETDKFVKLLQEKEIPYSRNLLEQVHQKGQINQKATSPMIMVSEGSFLLDLNVTT